MDVQIAALGLGPRTSVSPPSRHNNSTPPSVLTSSLSPAVVVVDPVSTGACLAHALASEHPLICVWSDMCPDTVRAHTKAGTEVDYLAKIEFNPKDVQAILSALRDVAQIRDVMVGCETGVLLGDELSFAANRRGNGVERSELRRNKWLQTEAVRDAGLNACGQYLVNSTKDVEKVLKGWPKGKFKAVVKPVVGAGSDGVSICDTHQQVRDAFRALEGFRKRVGVVLAQQVVLLAQPAEPRDAARAAVPFGAAIVAVVVRDLGQAIVGRQYDATALISRGHGLAADPVQRQLITTHTNESLFAVLHQRCKRCWRRYCRRGRSWRKNRKK